MTIQSNVKRLNELQTQVRNHCMCACLVDDGDVLRIIYPAGEWPQGLNGIQCSYGRSLSKADAYQRLLDRMEKDWNDSFPGAAK